MARKFINYCYTLNNWTEEEYIELQKIICKYHIIGKEVGENNTPHLQGFIGFTNARSFKQVVKMNTRWHIEPCMGNPNQNMDYCSKDGDFIEIGERPGQGKRNDLTAIKKLAKANAKNVEIYEAASGLQGYRMGILGKQLYSQKRNWITKVYWWYGATGTGKSKKAFEMFPEAHVQRIPKWWDGYDNHSEVIMDEYRCDWFTFSNLLGLLDRYSMTVESKGGVLNFAPKYICITTNKHPKDMWSGRTEEDIAQLLRRITEIVLFEKN